MIEFPFRNWIRSSIELGGETRRNDWHINYRAAAFKSESDRNIFLELSREQYPNEEFIPGSLSEYSLFIIQHKERQFCG